MPLLPAPHVRSPLLLRGGHLQTILPSIFRKVPGITFKRERLELADGDFLDLDWAPAPGCSTKLVVLTHGLEGDSHRHYIKGLARAFTADGWDALAWNCRSCSGEMNRLERLYHHAATDDLAAVVNHALATKPYDRVGLVGVSMGGSLTLKYLGENGNKLPAAVIGGVAFSVPTDLAGSEAQLAKPSNWVYIQRFLKKLKRKLELKSSMFPGLLDLKGYDSIKRFLQFDDRYTAPLHGFASAKAYYQIASGQTYFDGLLKPVLIANAANDPFLSSSCYPAAYAAQSEYVHLEVPPLGGHVGFTEMGTTDTWAERRAVAFMNTI